MSSKDNIPECWDEAHIDADQERLLNRIQQKHEEFNNKKEEKPDEKLQKAEELLKNIKNLQLPSNDPDHKDFDHKEHESKEHKEHEIKEPKELKEPREPKEFKDSEPILTKARDSEPLDSPDRRITNINIENVENLVIKFVFKL
jgi:hypothetical protein